eukprot:1158017-Pelagomonas_calceolata.AAC.2
MGLPVPEPLTPDEGAAPDTQAQQEQYVQRCSCFKYQVFGPKLGHGVYLQQDLQWHPAWSNLYLHAGASTAKAVFRGPRDC